MLLCQEKDKEEVFQYIGEKYGQCLYLYIDLLKYGIENENIKLWCQKEKGEIRVLVFQYYSGVHVFSSDRVFDVEDVAKLLRKIKPSLICGMKQTIQLIEPYMDNYQIEIGKVAELKQFKEFDDGNSYCAKEEELEELAAMLAEDEALGKPYGFELLYNQIKERYNEKFGRNYVYRDCGKIVATASTYAEQGGAAVISGVMVAPEQRGKGLSKKVLSALCKELLNENFRVFSYYYIESAMRMHKAVGFEEIGEWAKLIRD